MTTGLAIAEKHDGGLDNRVCPPSRAMTIVTPGHARSPAPRKTSQVGTQLAPYGYPREIALCDAPPTTATRTTRRTAPRRPETSS